MKIKFAVTTVAAVIVLGGWENNMQRDLGADFGNATRHNFAVQVIDPDPSYAKEGAPALNGRRAIDAYERYQAGKVKKTKTESTTRGVATQ